MRTFGLLAATNKRLVFHATHANVIIIEVFSVSCNVSTVITEAITRQTCWHNWRHNQRHTRCMAPRLCYRRLLNKFSTKFPSFSDYCVDVGWLSRKPGHPTLRTPVFLYCWRCDIGNCANQRCSLTRRSTTSSIPLCRMFTGESTFRRKGTTPSCSGPIRGGNSVLWGIFSHTIMPKMDFRYSFF